MNKISKIPKHGFITPGLACHNVAIGLESKKAKKKEDPAKVDRMNRLQVVNEIEKLVNSGVVLEDACEKMVKTHKNKFSYFTEENLAQIFKNWYNGKNREKREIEKGF